MDMPHERLQKFGVVDYASSMMILAIIEDDKKETIAGIGQYDLNRACYTAEVAQVVKDEYQKMGGVAMSCSIISPTWPRNGTSGVYG